MNNNIQHDNEHRGRSAGVIFCNNCAAKMMIMVQSSGEVPNFSEMKINNCLVCGTGDVEFCATLNKGVGVVNLL